MNAKVLSAILIPTVVVGSYCLWPESPASVTDPKSELVEHDSAKVKAAESEALAKLPPEPVELSVGVSQQLIVADCTGNGRDKLSVILQNKAGVPLKVHVPVGQTFESERSLMVTVRAADLVIAPGKTAEMEVSCAAVRSVNKVLRTAYTLSSQTVPRIELFLTYVQEHPELSVPAIQTAILALTDNLPVSAVAKFQMAGGALPSRFNTDAFRVETHDIVSALAALKQLGIKDYQIAMTIDPQLRIEAMIDPLSRPLAMNYYGIAPEAEWGYWKNELLSGEPATRHYALYGIARFYPDVALDMLPRWVRETRTNPVYRLSAAQALADTQKPEALPILRQLVNELGEDTELGKAANAAAEYLDYRLSQLSTAQAQVAFRTGKVDQTF